MSGPWFQTCQVGWAARVKALNHWVCSHCVEWRMCDIWVLWYRDVYQHIFWTCMNEDYYALLRFRVISCLRGWVGKTWNTLSPHNWLRCFARGSRAHVCLHRLKVCTGASEDLSEAINWHILLVRVKQLLPGCRLWDAGNGGKILKKRDCLCHKFGENHANWTIRSSEVSDGRSSPRRSFSDLCPLLPIVAQLGSNRSFDERIVGNTFPAAVRHSVQTAMSEASGHRTFAKPTPSMCNTVPAIESF